MLCGSRYIVKIDNFVSCRSYNALQNSPLVLKLVPAVAIIVFAVWGLGPLMCQSRNLLLHVCPNYLNFDPCVIYYLPLVHTLSSE